MDRDQAVELVRIYDGLYPEEYEAMYLDYFNMNQEELQVVLNTWTNLELFDIIGSSRVPKFVVR